MCVAKIRDTSQITEPRPLETREEVDTRVRQWPVWAWPWNRATAIKGRPMNLAACRDPVSWYSPGLGPGVGCYLPLHDLCDLRDPTHENLCGKGTFALERNRTDESDEGNPETPGPAGTHPEEGTELGRPRLPQFALRPLFR